MEIKEKKQETMKLLKMMHGRVESLNAKSLLFTCKDAKGKLYLYAGCEQLFKDKEIYEIKTFKTLLAIQLNDGVVVLNKDTYKIIATYPEYRMTMKKVSDKTPFALLEMIDKDSDTRIVVFNIKTRKIAGLYDWANWRYDGCLVVLDKDGREFRY